jgi:hypothetical protein
VVEVKKHRICDAAVDAGDPKRANLLTSPFSALRVVSADVRDVPGSVASIPVLRVGTLTLKADPLSRLQRE